MFHHFVSWLSTTIGQWGYSGIIVLMTLESSFFPFPSEVVIPPAAYLAAKGEMTIGMVIFCGTLGSLVGSIINYWLALKFGRLFFKKYGRYLLVSQKSLGKADLFFEHHGHISTFVGRVLGAGIWVVTLAAMGYWFGQNEQLVIQNLHWLTMTIMVGCATLVIFYLHRQKHRLSKEHQGGKK